MDNQRVAIVTGGSRGIGRAIAEELASAGFRTVVNYATRPDAAESVVESISSAGGVAVSVGGDVGQAEDRQRLVDTTLEKFGRIDVLVNNAGITSQGRNDLLQATEASWDLVFDTNLKGPFFLSQRVAQAMLDLISRGKITTGQLINISSISAYAVSTNRADYCMTKAALEMMTQLFATRLANENIGVFEICPGIIESDMTAPVREKYDQRIAQGLTPIRRWGRTEDVARAVRAIVDGYFPFSTGERFNIDGGFHIRSL